MDVTAATETLTSPPSLHEQLPTFPFDLIPEILCRLPVKLLIQLKCVCKSWKSLISDPKFAKKHLRMSTACHDHHHLIVASTDTKYDAFSIHAKLLLWDSTISSISNNVLSTSIVPQLQLMYPEAPLYDGHSGRVGCVVSSCDGILLFDIHQRSPLLWNPSIRKFKILPPFLNPSRGRPFYTGRLLYTIGYDHFIDNYKIFAVSTYSEADVNQWKNEVSVYTLGYDSLGYDSWRRIDDIPCDGPIYEAGIFVSRTVNWLAFDASGVNWLAFDASGSSLHVLVSLDLEKESYRKLSTPDLNKSRWTLGVLMNCLCIFTNSDEFLDVWVMKEYGIKESWTKLFSIPYVGGDPSSFPYTEVVYVYEDDLMLLDCKQWKLVVYNSRNGSFKIPMIGIINSWMVPKVYVESLISPCS